MGYNPGLTVTWFSILERTTESEQSAVDLYTTQTGEEEAIVIPETGTINGVWLVMGENGILAFKDPE